MPASLTSNQMKDVGLSRFKKTNLYYTDDVYYLYQDPTWLGFKLLFFFNQDDSRLLWAPSDEASTNPGAAASPSTAPKNSAYSYLKSIGEGHRANYLAKFVNHLQKMNNKTPWFFQTIEGLGDAWKRGYHEDEFKSMLPKDRKITIGCLESIDLRVTALMDLYRKACFDWKYRREIVPWNLRTFTVYIYIYEIRNINRTGKPSPSGLLDLSQLVGIQEVNVKQQNENARLLGADPLDDGKNPVERLKDKAAGIQDGFGDGALKGIKNALSPAAQGNESANTINPNISRVLYRFSYCEFLPDESSVVLDKTSNFMDDEPTQQKIVFSYRDVEEINLSTIYSGDKLIQDAIVGELDKAAFDAPLFGSVKKANELGFNMQDVINDKFGQLGPLANGLAAAAADRLERLISSFAGKLLLGNVYGFSAANVAGALGGVLSGDPTQLIQGAEALASPFTNKSKRNDTNDVSVLGRYHDQNPSQGNVAGRLAKNNSTSEGSSIGNKSNDINSIVAQYERRELFNGNTSAPSPEPVTGNSLNNNTTDANNPIANSGSAGPSINNNSKSASGNIYEQ
jgi:hypothetical protein